MCKWCRLNCWYLSLAFFTSVATTTTKGIFSRDFLLRRDEVPLELGIHRAEALPLGISEGPFLYYTFSPICDNKGYFLMSDVVTFKMEIMFAIGLLHLNVPQSLQIDCIYVSFQKIFPYN